MTASKALLYFCLSFAVGIFLASLFQVSWYLLPGFLITGIFLASVFWKYKTMALIGFSILFLALGVWRCQAISLKIAGSELLEYNDSKEKISLTGIVSAEPDIRNKSIKFVFKPEGESGKILVTADRYPEYRYGDKLTVTGKLESPQIFNDFNYKNYLKKDGIYSVVNFPEIELIGSGFGDPVMSALLSFKNKFKETTRSFISPPQQGFLEALVFGDESLFSDEWKNKLNITGTRHIAAVSGMNITILAFIILALCLSFGLWRQQALFLSMILLVLYVLMIGAPASAVRAGIMAGILMIAQQFGRLSSASRAIIFTACLMLWFNPFLLALDVGFQLSFLAIFGLVYLQPTFFNWLRNVPDPKIFPIRTTFSATLSAQFFTLPILIYNFGYIPVLSPVANILIVPLLAPVTVLIFVFGVAGMIFSPLGSLLSWPVWLLLSFIAFLIDWFSKIPVVSLTVSNIHWIWPVILYLILSSFAFWLNRRERLKFLKY